MPIKETHHLSSPLHFVDLVFDEQSRALEIGENRQMSEGLQIQSLLDRVSQFFEKKVSPEKWPEIPSLNDVPIENLSEGQLVRFRGMLQVRNVSRF